jgi:hypothetical protein
LNNLTALFTFITSVTTSSDFGVLVCVIRFLDPSVDPNSCTILLPSLNSNGNPFANFGLLGGTCNSMGLNSSKPSYVTTFSVYSSVAIDLPVFFVVVATNVVRNAANVVNLKWFPSNLNIHLHQSANVFHPLEPLCHVPP